MASLFAVGLPFTFDGTTNHFATTSGGTASVAAVTSADTVTVDSLSGNATLTVGAAWTCSALTINNASATVACDATHGLNATGTVTHTAGTLNTNGQTCSWGSFIYSNTAAATLTITSSNITITGAGTALSMSGAGVATNLTVNASGSTITMSGVNVTMQPGTKTWGSLIFNGSGTAQVTAGSSTFANLTRTGTASKTDQFAFFANHTITGVLTVTGNSTTNRVFFNSGVPGAQDTITVNGSVSLTNVDIMDFKSAGTAGTWTGISLGDCGGNTGMTFDAPVSQTWSGNTTGSWSTAANWTSRVPLPQDPVLISGLTSGTLTVDMPRLGAGVDFTGSTAGHVTLTINFSVFGSWTYVSTLVVTGNFQFTFAGRGAYTLTCAGIGPATSSNVAAPGGTYTLQDDFKFQNPAAGINFTGGTFDANGHDVVTTGVNSFPGNVNMGSGTWTLTGTGVIWQSPTGTFNSQTSTIIISDTSATAKTFNGNGKTYYNVIVKNTPDNITITGANTYRLLEYHAPLRINNYQQVSVGDGMSVTERIR